MKTQILFTIHYLELGGAEMSLLGLLESLDYSKVDVDLFLYSHRGELMKFIPHQVNLLPENPAYRQIERPVKDVLQSGYLRIALARIRARRKAARYIKRHSGNDSAAIYSYISRELIPILPEINPEKEYDIAVSYLMPHDYVLRKVRAKEKVAWIHTDYSKMDVDAQLELPVWAGYDRIVSISADVTKNFLQVFPSLADKIEERPNLVSEQVVKSQAVEIAPEFIEKDMPKADGRINLLSVGRFSYPKNYDNIPDICRRIRANGIDAVWYLIGFGSDEHLIRSKISESGAESYVRILGKKENPYPYMKACDIYVQPSRYEGSPMTVLEANLLEKPVVLTSFPTAESVAGLCSRCVIVPMDNEGCAKGIYDFIGKISNL